MTTRTNFVTKENGFDETYELTSKNDPTESESAVELLPEKIIIPQIVFHLPIEALPLSVRLDNVLNALNVRELGELDGMSFNEFQKTRNCGLKTVNELKEILERANVGEFDDWLNEISVRAVGQANLTINIDDLLETELDAGFTIHANATFLYVNNRLFIPERYKEISLSRLPLSVRLNNVLAKADCKVLGDLQNLDFNEFRKTRNCGEKTVVELFEFIRRIQSSNAASADSRRAAAVEGAPDNQPLDVLVKELNLLELLNFINEYIAELPTRDKIVLLDRFGGTSDETLLTLEEVGAKQQITRERVRQIQSKTLKKLKARLGQSADFALRQLHSECSNAVCPLTPNFLIYLTENDYSLFQFPPAFYIRILSELKAEIPVVPDGRFGVEQVTGKAAGVARQIEELFKEQSEPIAVADIFQQIIDFGATQHASENDFFEALQSDKFVVTAGLPNQLFVETIRNKHKATDIVFKVLARSNEPLTPEEIIERAKAIHGENAIVPLPRTLENLHSYTAGLYLLGKRALGLRQHFKLPPEKWDELRADFYDLLKQETRPLSTGDVIAKKLFDWTEVISPYEAAYILRDDARFTDLGRFLFALSDWQIGEREHIKDLIVKILQEAAHPLTANEIGEAIQKRRSASVTALQMILKSMQVIERYDFGAFGFYGLSEWNDNFTEFFVANSRLVYSLIKRSKPVTFAELCRFFEITADGELSDRLWETLQTLPKLRFAPQYKSPETKISRYFWT